MVSEEKEEKKPNTLKRNIARWLLLGFVALVLGLNVYKCNAKKLLGDQMPMPLGYGASVVVSGSMEPTLSIGDMVIVKKTKDVKVGDIVVFQSGNILVIHTVIEVGDGVIVTKGDANNVDDGEIALSAVKGKMVFAIPKVGYAVDVIRHPVSVILILGGSLFLLERSYRKEKKEGVDELDEIKKEIEDLKKE